jgi:hypothetical protein
MSTFCERERKMQEAPRDRELTESESAKVERIRKVLIRTSQGPGSDHDSKGEVTR